MQCWQVGKYAVTPSHAIGGTGATPPLGGLTRQIRARLSPAAAGRWSLTAICSAPATRQRQKPSALAEGSRRFLRSRLRPIGPEIPPGRDVAAIPPRA